MKSLGLSDEDVQKLQSIVDDRRNSGSRMDVLGEEKPSELRCPECNLRITETPTWGEVGHHPQCARRDERYRGRVGSMGPSPPNAKTERELVADGGER